MLQLREKNGELIELSHPLELDDPTYERQVLIPHGYVTAGLTSRPWLVFVAFPRTQRPTFRAIVDLGSRPHTPLWVRTQ